MKSSIVFTLMSMALMSCSANDEALFHVKGGLESKPASTGNQQSASIISPAKKVVSAVYELKVSSAAGLELCTGEANIDIMNDFSLDVPVAVVNCLALVLDLKELLKSLEPKLKQATAKSKLSSDGKMIYIDRISDAVFLPPRPLLIGPVIQDVSLYQGYDVSSSHQLTIAKQDQLPQTGNGSIQVKVIGINERFARPGLDESFDQVLRWTMDTSGFEGLPISNGGLFDHIEFNWNVRPIMMPRLLIVGRLGNIIQTIAPLDILAGALVGPVTVELVIKKFERFQ